MDMKKIVGGAPGAQTTGNLKKVINGSECANEDYQFTCENEDYQFTCANEDYQLP